MVYIDQFRMMDNSSGQNLSCMKNVHIDIDKTLFARLSEGWFEEDFYVRILTKEKDVIHLLDSYALMGKEVYLGFWIVAENRLFQIQMQLYKKDNGIFSEFTYVIDGFPEIFPIATSYSLMKSPA